jgi:hypothetical protein
MTLCSRNRVLVRAPVKGSLAFLQPGGAETSFTVIASKKQVRTGGARHAMGWDRGMLQPRRINHWRSARL